MKTTKKIFILNTLVTCQKKVSLTILALFALTCIKAQDSAEEKPKEEALQESIGFTYEGNEAFSEKKDVVEAEVNYRKAISKNADNAKAKYNLGNIYYKEDSMGEAFMRYKEAGTTAKSKEEKHKAYHNLGNVFMKNKEYQKAVDAYKEALRNNPADEETRYNLALAKELLKKQQDQQKNNPDKNKDQQDQDKENKDQQDKKEDKGDDKKDSEEKGEEKDKNNEGDKKDEQGDKPEDKKQDQGKDDKEDGKQEKNSGDKSQQQQPRPNQLSPQQIKNILEAMNNEEKKVQEKLNAEKVKGTPVKSEKDW